MPLWSKILVVVMFFSCLALAFSTLSEVKGSLTVGLENENPDTVEETTVDADVKSELYFVGDIMLGRDVERKMLRNGFDYPYQKINFDSENSFVLANFESSIPAVHVPTPDNTFRLSVNKNSLAPLRKAGFTHLSLANNHAFDFGLAGYNNTLSTLWENNFIPFGHPTLLATSSVTILELDGTKIALVAVHTLFNAQTNKNVEDVLAYADTISDIQVVYIHWGEEYAKNQSTEQRKFARLLSGAGADIIVGHHPHVVQGIEMINSTLVFYSLGNYIFDQYFSDSVKTGLILKLKLGVVPTIELIPVSSQSVLAQPQIMNEPEKSLLLDELVKNSDSSLSDQIKSGFILITLPLASSTEIAIMAE